MPVISPRARATQAWLRVTDAVDAVSRARLRNATAVAAMETAVGALRAAEEAAAAAAKESETASDPAALERGREARRAVEAAREAVSKVTAQQLDELRVLPSPPVPVRRALCLLHAVLHPHSAASDGLANLRWQPDLTGMLRRRDELLRTLKDLPADSEHPLIRYPEVAALIRAHVDVSSDPAPPRRAASFDRAPRRRSVVPAAAVPQLRRSMTMPTPHVGVKVWEQPEDLTSLPTLVLRQRATADGVDAHGSRADVLGRLQERQPTPAPLRPRDVACACKPAAALLHWVVSQLHYVEATKDGHQLIADADKVEGLMQRLEAALRSAAAAADGARADRDRAAAEAAAADAALRDAGEAEARARLDHANLCVQLQAECVCREQSKRTALAGAELEARGAMAAERRTLLAEHKRRRGQLRHVEFSEEQCRLGDERAEDEARRSLKKKWREEEAKRREREEAKRREREEAKRRERERAKEERVPGAGCAELQRLGAEVTERVQFPKGSASVTPTVAVSTLPAVLRVMQSRKGVKLLVEGTAGREECRDAVGLATRRAREVAEHLVAQGVSPARLRQAGFAADGDRGEVTFSVIQEIKLGSNVEFGACSSSLAGSASQLLHSVASILRSQPMLRVRIEGHTCGAPNWGCSNQELSEMRAHAVAEWLAQHGGVQAGRLAAVGLGDRLPVAAPPPGRSGQPKNRRVEFHVLSRESVSALHDIATNQAACARIAADPGAVTALMDTATARGNPLPRSVRLAAADVLVCAGVGWQGFRQLWMAVAVPQSPVCLLRKLPKDVVRQIMRQYFMIGCGYDDAADCRPHRRRPQRQLVAAP
eukprot:TRINITY_DN3287_c0_g1_i1.p1 TRINITY_DN3287_c0_g1~~TRINITY_DN3287_c0_g1_i1.p1  ORF type:complete len:829 (+),score=352.57 TRINITY_DN3287_c0_g1_i1:57-2543(+)